MKDSQDCALCIPKHTAAAILRRGLTFATHEHIDTRLLDLMENADAVSSLTAEKNADLLWLKPFVIVGNQANYSCFISSYQQDKSIGHVPMSMGLTGYCYPHENAEVAAARILHETLGYSPDDIISAGMIGFIWIDYPKAYADSIAIVYKVLVNDPNRRTIDGARYHGEWMRSQDMFRLLRGKVFDAWSEYLFHTQSISGLFADTVYLDSNMQRGRHKTVFVGGSL